MKNNRAKHTTDVIIIGGGVSGLYAAQKCIANGLSVMLIEKEKRLGGRIHTIYGNGYQYETGAGRFAQTHVLLRKLLREYDLTEVANSKRYSFNGGRTPAQGILRTLIRMAKNVPYDKLISVTFKSLCQELLGVNQTQLLIHSFGYNAEFEIANAYTAINMFKRDFLSHAYFSCKEGFSELIRRMERFVSKYSLIYTLTEVKCITNKPNECVIVHAVDRNGILRQYNCKAVICTIPKNDLEKLEQLTTYQRDLINNVAPVSLHRLYGKFPVNPKPWFSNVFRTSTDDDIRQFIPVNKKQGLAMVSYSDTHNADMWKKHADKGNNHLQKEVLKHLHAVFPNVHSIPQPQWVKSYYWPAGVHLWKAGTDVDTVVPQIQHITGDDGRVFVAGEAFCKIQGWIEGALSSVEDIMPHVLHIV